MSANTGIEWCDATWNPVRGCALVSPGCQHCYAMKQAHRFSGDGMPYEGLTEIGPAGPRWTGRVVCDQKMLAIPLRWRKPRRIFVNSMSDLFHEDVPEWVADEVTATMVLAPWHHYIVLTKRAERQRDYWSHPGRRASIATALFRRLRSQPGDEERVAVTVNAAMKEAGWPLTMLESGVSVENQHFADERIPLLLQTPAAVRSVSYEPALGPIDFTGIEMIKAEGQRPAATLNALTGHVSGPDDMWPRIDQLYIGGESGPGARPCDVAWIRSAVQQCRQAGVSCFVKQMGAYVIDRNDRLGTDRPPADDHDWPEPECGWDDSARGNIVRDLNGTRDGYQGAPIRIRLRDRKGSGMTEWPADLRVRQLSRKVTTCDDDGVWR